MVASLRVVKAKIGNKVLPMSSTNLKILANSPLYPGDDYLRLGAHHQSIATRVGDTDVALLNYLDVAMDSNAQVGISWPELFNQIM